MEQLQHMYAAVNQQLAGSMAGVSGVGGMGSMGGMGGMGGMSIRRTRGSVGSLDGGRVFNDAIAWISQQKVRASQRALAVGRF